MCERCAAIVKANLEKLTPYERSKVKNDLSNGDIKLAIEMQEIIDSIEKDKKKKKWFGLF